MEITEQITIALEESNRTFHYVNVSKTQSGYYEKDIPQILTKFASSKINGQEPATGTDYDLGEITATDEISEDTAGSASLLREVILTDSSGSGTPLTLYYANSDFKA